MQTILGIDPGSRITGYGLIQSNGFRHQYVSSGCIRTQGELPERLNQIFQGLSQIITEFVPAQVAIEEVFMHRNANSALKLGQARGAIIVAVSKHTIPIAEYATRRVKQSVVGNGGATKEQVQHMVTHLLKLSGTPQAD